MTYAEDPAVAVVELYNEDSALWYGPLWGLTRYPTVRKKAGRRFTEWLTEKYGDKEGLLEAWGEEALNSVHGEELPEESFEEKKIWPGGNPNYYTPDQLEGEMSHARQRLHDTMKFLYEVQNDFYGKYVKAIRETGYEGEILSSNWQAGRAYSHYYNLHSDYKVGLIDRHNYFGGGEKGEPFNNASMLSTPGSGMFSTGMQQVVDRPFMLSEWIHVYPNEWGVEGPAIIGAYGLGLQDWDVSYMFQNGDDGGFSDRIGGHNWDVTAPQVLGVFPAVARQVLRGDVKASDTAAPRRVHVPSLYEGKLGFEDQVKQQYDVKTFDSDKVPAETLAVARCVVDFTDSYRETPQFDLAPYRRGDALLSTTGQLRWQKGASKQDGHFTIDTPATKAVVGFAEGTECRLGDVTITPRSHFSAVYVTAQGQEQKIASADKLVVVAMARARNTGMRFNEEENKVLEKGEAPVRLEAVKAEISIERPGEATVVLLDHDGLRTDRTIPVENGTFTIDGSRDKTPYYLIEYGG
jgi:hypothetical protein